MASLTYLNIFSFCLSAGDVHFLKVEKKKKRRNGRLFRKLEKLLSGFKINSERQI